MEIDDMKKILCAGFLMLMGAGIAFGELKAGSQTLSIQAGGGSSSNEYNWQGTGAATNVSNQKATDPGGAVGGQYIYYLSSKPTFGIGADINYTFLQGRETGEVLQDFSTGTRFRPLTVLSIAKLTFGPGRLHPYLFGGLGFHQTSFLLQLTPKPGQVWSDTGTSETRRTVDGTGTGFAAAVGFGLDMFVSPNVFVGAEVRGTHLGTANYGHTAAGTALGMGDLKGSINLTNYLVRIGTKFGE
jgi:opacity protein-like surface antigen